MDFQITAEQKRLQQRCRDLAEDFATRAALHDRDASNPAENYAALRREGFYGLNVPHHLGGWGVGLLGYSLAAEELAQGCPSTALSFNMHLSIVGSLMESPEVLPVTKQRLANLVVQDRKLIAGNFSEPATAALLGTHVAATRARRVDGGYRISGRKAFASMLEAADYCAVLTHPEESQSASAAVLLLVPRHASGRLVEHVWDTLGMRATCSDSLILEDCWVPEDAVLLQTEDVLPFRRSRAGWLWASYTAVYLGVGAAAYKEAIKVLKQRRPHGYSQPLAYHPDVRRHIAEMSVDLEAARLMTYHSAWLSDTQGPTPETLAAFYRAKYMVGEAVTRVTRTALTLGGAHALFKTAPLERLFRDGAIAPMQFPPRDFCLASLGILELDLDPREVLPPLKSDQQFSSQTIIR
jgi:alkylation response protein AidB-like acyl-CoA dehydrogenase